MRNLKIFSEFKYIRNSMIEKMQAFSTFNSKVLQFVFKKSENFFKKKL